MKTVFVIPIILFFVTSLSAFGKDTVNLGGSASFSRYKYYSDADAFTTISFTPQVGYFFIDNITADLLINFTSVSNRRAESMFAVGFGGRYFYRQFYGGTGFMMVVNNYDGFKVSENCLDFKTGYLVSLVENVFFDLGMLYRMGIGKYGRDGSGDNDQSLFSIKFGLQIFFSIDR